MAIDLSSDPAGLFARWGAAGALANDIWGFLGVTAPSPSSVWASPLTAVDCLEDDISAIFAGYQTTNQQLTDGLYSARDSYRSVHGSMLSYLQTLAGNVIVKMADDDVQLTTKDVPTALNELISQMLNSGDSIKANTVSASTSAAAGNIGNGTLRVSAVNQFGSNLQYLFPENINFICSQDSQQGGTARQEVFQYAGDSAQSDLLSWDYPKGSGASGSLTVVDSDQDASGGQMLTNGPFEEWTSNTPDNWDASGATPGTTLLKEGSVVSRGAAALRFVGNGSELTAVTQTFNVSSGGTVSTLTPDTVYAVNCYARKTSGFVAGTLAMELVNGSNTIIQDDAGTNNQIAVTNGTLTTSYAVYGGFFRTPKVLPSTVKFRLRLSVAGTNGESVYVDDLAMTPASQLYQGGPFAAMFAGVTNFYLNDKLVGGISNDRGSKWASLLDRFFDPRTLGIQFPYSGSPTIDDAWIE